MFVKDLSAAKQREFEELFRDLDTGPPDGIPAAEEDTDDHVYLTDSESDKNEKLMPTGDIMKSKDTEETTKTVTNLMLDKETTRTDFRQDLYGLQHNIIMQKVLSAKTSSKFRPVIDSADSDGKSIEFSRTARFTEKKSAKKDKPVSLKQLKARYMKQLMDEERFAEDMFGEYMKKYK